MKRIRNVFGYFALSVLLFYSGISLNVSPTDNLGIKDIVQQNDQNQQDNQNQQNDPSLYYYSLLDDTKKKYYDQISAAVADEADSVILEGITYEEAEKIYISVHYDHPEYFWLENQYTYREYDGSVEFTFDYNCTGGERKNRQRMIEQQAAQIVNAMPAESSDYEKVKYVFKSLVDQTQYNHDNKSNPQNQNIYSTFGEHLTVCAGYAKGTKYLLDQMGVECIYVTGMAGEYHAWNIVKCNGAYYCVDTTWGDPAYNEGDAGTNTDTTQYEYLCCSTEMLSRSHTPDAIFPIPECTDTSLEYYRLAGRYLTAADLDPVLQIMKEDIDNGEKYTKIQFATPELVNQVYGQIDLIYEEMRAYAGNMGTIYHMVNEPAGVLTVIWYE